MLQQTRVDTALPYYERFLVRWPTLGALAAAEPDDVLQAWAGLGYYSRATNLHRCAMVAHDAGGLPSDPAALRKLPGIGPYTAGAVASIAFGVRTPLVDGNVERVLSRLDARDADPRSPNGRRALWARAASLHEHLQPAQHPGDLNQALMELGATCCTPMRPTCSACPLRGKCAGAADGHDPTRFPKTTPRRKPTPVFAVAGLYRRGHAVLLGRRPKGLLGGLWEPIGAPVESLDAAVPDAVLRAFSEGAGTRATLGASVGQVVHTFTHRRLTCRVWTITEISEASASGQASFYTDIRLVDPESVALSSLARKILALGEQPPMLFSGPQVAGG